MKKIILMTSFLLAGKAMAFPPAPHHEVYGVLRDESGNPLASGPTIRLIGPAGPVVSGPVDASIGLGVNYSLKVPMDAGTRAQLYRATALFPIQPFTVEVVIGGTSYVPIEIQGGGRPIGKPGGRTRLDLTLGVDQDQDGLPDSWEEKVMAFTSAESLAEVRPEGDSDHDGLSNQLEYLAGTYAFSNRAVFRLEILEVGEERVKARFLATKGRRYLIKSSDDGKTFAPIRFSLSADGSDARDSFLSSRVRFQEVYLPLSESKKAIYSLHVY